MGGMMIGRYGRTTMLAYTSWQMPDMYLVALDSLSDFCPCQETSRQC